MTSSGSEQHGAVGPAAARGTVGEVRAGDASGRAAAPRSPWFGRLRITFCWTRARAVSVSPSAPHSATCRCCG